MTAASVADDVEDVEVEVEVEVDTDEAEAGGAAGGDGGGLPHAARRQADTRRGTSGRRWG